MNSREKGKRGEREAAGWWRDSGFDTCARGQQYKGGPDSPDVVNVPGLHVEVKRRAKIANFREWLLQAAAEAAPGKIPVVQARADRGDWMFVLGEAEFMQLYQAWLQVQDAHPQIA